jgi:hypothetical protein
MHLQIGVSDERSAKEYGVRRHGGLTLNYATEWSLCNCTNTSNNILALRAGVCFYYSTCFSDPSNDSN